MAVDVEFYPNALAVLLRSENGTVGREILRRTLRVEKRAKELCPVNTGRLRASIRHRLVTERNEVVGIVGSDVDYALYVHEGTRLNGYRKRPFLREALEEAK